MISVNKDAFWALVWKAITTKSNNRVINSPSITDGDSVTPSSSLKMLNLVQMSALIRKPVI